VKGRRGRKGKELEEDTKGKEEREGVRREKGEGRFPLLILQFYQ